ncbi:MAG: nitrogen regulatory protein [Firmicutes bacterium]|nr:nitrogen regulatory protein [Bacillota bacterium]
MLMVRAIIRPEKKEEVLSELSRAGFHAATVLDVVGRGKQKGIKISGVVYDEIPKALIMMAIRDEDKEDIVRIILKYARTGDQGAYGDGKIFIAPVDEAYTISSGIPSL